VGALEGKGAVKGVFITTSGFSKDAKDFTNSLNSKKIVLIDGNRLADLMIDNDVGVSTVTDYKIKRLNEDYFSAID
ncbi:MAG: restriction endonuclease, partial [Candidatus Acidifodinimicrobium sp.]